MKSNKERVKYILETSEKRLNEQRIKRKKIEKYIAGTFCMCAVLILSVKFYSNNLLQPFPDIDVIESPPQTTTSSSETTYTTSSAYKNPVTEIAATEINSTEQSTIQTTNKTETCTETTLSNIITKPFQQTNTLMTSTDTILSTEILSVSTTQIFEISSEITTTSIDDTTEKPAYEKPLPWEEMPINQQYFMCDYDGNEYQTEKQEVSAENIGDLIGVGFMSGWDSFTDTYYHCEAEIFSILEKDSGQYIAVKFIDDEKFYIYKNCILFTYDSVTDITN